jgi:hypothetical protein
LQFNAMSQPVSLLIGGRKTRRDRVPVIVFGTSRIRRTAGPLLRINCRACRRGSVPAESFETEERITLYFVPLPTQREWHVVCSRCGADYLSDLPLDELFTRSSEETEWHLFPRVSLVAKSLAVASVMLFACPPPVGLGLGAAAMIMATRSGGWTYRVGLLGIVLNLLLWGGLFLRSALVELRVV